MRRKEKSKGQFDLFGEIIIDHFCGGGGVSTGAEFATGRPVDAAGNHDPDAILMHKTNHPYTEHFQESVWDMDPVKVCRGRPVGLAWFSPDCKHFSKAKGGKPVEKSIRGLAWVVLRWAAKVKPRVIILENVEEFVTWGPVRKGRPVKKKAGQTFRQWVNQLEALGYAVEWRELKACDYGAPTIRKRFFCIARCDGRPIVWPEPTHGPGLKPYRTAAEIIDWTLPCPSIFDTAEEIKEKYGITAIRPLAENTLRRIARGIKKFVMDNPKPFIVQVNHGGTDFRGQAAEEPLSTITGKHGYGIVEPCFAPWTVTNVTNATGYSVNEPIGTIRTGGGGGQMLIAPTMTAIGQTGFSEDRSYSVEEPVRTVVSKAEQCIIAPTLIQYHNEKHSGEVRGQAVDKPILTVDANPRYGMAAATLIQTGYGEAAGQKPRVPHLDKPLGTIVSGGKHAAVVAFMSKFSGGGYNGAGNKPDEPLSTVTAFDHNAVVTSHMCVLRNHQDGREWTEPMPTVMTSPGHFAEVRAFLIKYYGTGTGQEATEPLETVVSRDRFGIVTIDSVDYVIVDIGLRMLTPRELYNAQGFPPDYIIDHDYTGKPYSKSKQVARCGNAVPPPLAEALIRANLPEWCGNKIETMEELKKAITA